MKFLKYKFYNNEQFRTWLLLIGLFIVLPSSIFLYTASFDSFVRKTGCIFSTSGLIFLHVGLLFIIPLARTITWYKALLIVLFFVPSFLLLLPFHGHVIQIMQGFMLIGSYNSLYLFGIKSCLEVWKYRREKKVILAILLTSPLLIVFGLTMFAGFFFAINCF